MNKTQKMTKFRWTIVTLLFATITINYLDRQVLSLTWDEFIKPEFHFGDDIYGFITGFFSLFYAACYLF
ncbi:MAG: exuT, partial [Bacteroidetes bacterium]|nr:exuT [Bacteroidota bacterium]